MKQSYQCNISNKSQLYKRYNCSESTRLKDIMQAVKKAGLNVAGVFKP